MAYVCELAMQGVVGSNLARFVALVISVMKAWKPVLNQPPKIAGFCYAVPAS